MDPSKIIIHQHRTPHTVHRTLFWIISSLFTGIGIVAILSGQKILFIIPIALLALPIIYKKPEYLFFSLLALLPLSTEYQFNDSLGTDFPDEFMMIALSGLIVLGIIYKPSLVKKSFYEHPLFLLLIFHIGWILIATIFSEHLLLSVKYFLAKIWYIIPFVIAPQIFLTGKRSLANLAKCLLIPMVFVSVLALVRHSFFNFSFAQVNSTVTPFFRNHVNYAAMLVCIMPVTIAFIYLDPQKKVGKGYIILLSIIILALFLSYSRGAWLALLFGGICFIAIKKKMIQWLLLTLTVVILLTFSWLSYESRYLEYRPDFAKTIWHKDFAEHLEATYKLRDVSTAERFYRWIAGIRMSGDHLLSGVGPNGFYESYRPYTVSVYKTWVSQNYEHSTVHNYFLLTLDEQGVPGLIIFCLLLFSAFYYSQKLYHRCEDKVYRTSALAIGCILGMITTVNFLSDLIETDKIGSLLFLCIGLLIWIDRQQRSGLASHVERIPQTIS